MDAQGVLHHGAVLGDVYVLAGEHRVAAGSHATRIRQDQQRAHGLVVDALLRVVEEQPGALGGNLPVVTKELVRDLIPDLTMLNGYVADKVEGFAIDAAGTGYVITDNDGVDDSSGETLFFSIGAM